MKNIVVADYIVANKKAHNLTYEYISSESDVPLSTVNAYSKGLVKEPKEETVVRIASVWGDGPEVIRALYKSFTDFESKARDEQIDKEITDRFVDKISPIIVKLLTESREDSDARYNRRLEKVKAQYAELYGKQEAQYGRSVAYLQNLVRNISFALISVVMMTFLVNAASGAYAIYAYVTFDIADPTRGLFRGTHYHLLFLVALMLATLIASIYSVRLAIKATKEKEDK